jgi:hypothetical protein
MAKSRPYRPKLGTTRGVSEWQKLSTLGDCQRFFKWCIHSVRDQSLDYHVASALAQIGYQLVAVIKAQYDLADVRNFTEEELLSAVDRKIADLESRTRPVDAVPDLQ